MNSMLDVRSVKKVLWLIVAAALANGICLDLQCTNWVTEVDAASSRNLEPDLIHFRSLKTEYSSIPLRLQGGRAIYGTLPAKAKPELRDLNLQVLIRCVQYSFIQYMISCAVLIHSIHDLSSHLIFAVSRLAILSFGMLLDGDKRSSLGPWFDEEPRSARTAGKIPGSSEGCADPKQDRNL
jgi:hypothetical protein